MTLQELKQKLLQNSEFKQEYERYDLSFEIGQMVLEARMIKGITQEKLATLMKTKQSGIARLESGKNLPSLTFLEKVANAFQTKLRVTLDLVEKMKIVHKSRSVSETQKITYSLENDNYPRIFHQTGKNDIRDFRGGLYA